MTLIRSIAPPVSPISLQEYNWTVLLASRMVHVTTWGSTGETRALGPEQYLMQCCLLYLGSENGRPGVLKFPRTVWTRLIPLDLQVA